MSVCESMFRAGSPERALASGFNFLDGKCSGFVIESAESLREIGRVTIGGVCEFCSRVYAEPLPVEYQGKRGMVLRKFFPGMLTIATGGDYHLYIQGKAICWQPTDTGLEEYRLLALDRIFKFTDPIGKSTGNVDDDIAASVVLRTTWMARLKVPDFAVDVSGFSTGVATYDICLGPESVVMWEPWRECWLEDDQMDDDYEFDDDYLFDYGRRIDSYEYAGCDFPMGGPEFVDCVIVEEDEEVDVVCSEEVLRFNSFSGTLDSVSFSDVKSNVGTVACSVGVNISSCDSGKFVKCKPDLFDVRDITMAGLFSSRGGSTIVWSGLDLASNRVEFDDGDLVLSQHGYIPSRDMVDKYKLLSSDLGKLKCCMLERCGLAYIEFLYSLYVLRAGYSAGTCDAIARSLVAELRIAWANSNLCSDYGGVIGSSRLLNLVVAVLATRSLKDASLFLQCVFPVSASFSKLVTVNEVTNLYGLVSLAERNFEFCKRFSYVGDKLLRLVANLAYLFMCKVDKRYYSDIDGMLTKRNIGRPLVVGANLGLTQTSADNCRARFVLSILCCPGSLCSIGRDLGLLSEDVWCIFDGT